MSVEYNCILIRFGEIFLKGNNRKYFEDLLINNIKAALKPLKYTFLRSQGRYFVEDFENADEITERLKKVFGLHSVSPALKVKTDKETLFEAAVKMSPMSGKFRVTVKRADKRLPFTSAEMAGNIGGALLRASGGRLKVDLFDYDFDLNVDIRDNGYSYLFYDKIPCAGGLPVGSSGSGMLLLSGGIDSPVAGWLMAKRGVRLHAVHFHSFPYTGEPALQKVKDLAEKLSHYTGQVNLHVVPFTEIQYAIHEKCPASFMITIMRRFMMRIAEKIARKKECGALITGESLGQVAIGNDTDSTAVISNGEGVTAEKPKLFFLERYMQAYVAEVSAFIDAVVNDKEVAVSAEDGLKPVLIGLAAKKSLAENRPVKISEIG